MENLLISRYLRLVEPLSTELKLELLAALSENIKNSMKESKVDKRRLFNDLKGSWNDVSDDLESDIYRSRTISDKEISLNWKVVPLYSAIDIFAQEKVRLRKEGNLIPDFDLIIGCSAVANNTIIVTNNVKHLERIKGIKIENWRDAKFNDFLK